MVGLNGIEGEAVLAVCLRVRRLLCISRHQDQFPYCGGGNYTIPVRTLLFVVTLKLAVMMILLWSSSFYHQKQCDPSMRMAASEKTKMLIQRQAKMH